MAGPYYVNPAGVIMPTLSQQAAGPVAAGPLGAGPYSPPGAAINPGTLVEQAAGAAPMAANIPKWNVVAKGWNALPFTGEGALLPEAAPLGPWAIGGLAAGSLLAHPVGGLVKQLAGGDQGYGNAAESAIKDAALGASVGAMAGPWGAAIGGLGGGIYGGISGWFKKPKQDPIEKAFGSFTVYGATPAQVQMVRDHYNALKKQDPDGAKQYLAGMLQTAQQQYANSPGANPFAQNPSGFSPDQYLQMQQLAGQAMAPFVKDMRTNIDAVSNNVLSDWGNMSPATQAKLTPLIKNYASLSKNIGDAYALQTEMFPLQDAMARSSWQAMLQNSQGSGGSSLSSLLQQQAAATPTTSGG